MHAHLWVQVGLCACVHVFVCCECMPYIRIIQFVWREGGGERVLGEMFFYMTHQLPQS